MPADLHVLHVLSSAGLFGAEHAVLNLVPALRDLDIDSTVLCIDNPHLPRQLLFERARERNIPATRIPCNGRLDGATVLALRTEMARHRDAIVHVHGYKGAFYAARARGKRRAPPIVSTLHGWVTNTLGLRFYRWLELRLLRRFQAVCIVSAAMRTPLMRAGIDAKCVKLIENGIDTERFRPDTTPLSRCELGIPADAFLFGAVMRLSAEKNPLGLLEAFAKVADDAPRAWLVVAGEGPQRSEVERRAAELGVAARMRLVGARDDPERLYPMLDCFVLPSMTEGLPLSLLEAMAACRPVVATDVGQISTVLRGLPARVVTAGDVQALASALQDTMGVRPPVHALRERVEARYSDARMAREYAALYREIRTHHGHLAT